MPICFSYFYVVNMQTEDYDFLVIFSRKNAGKWVASKNGKVLAADRRLSKVLQQVKGYDRDAIRLDIVPKTPFLAGAHAL